MTSLRKTYVVNTLSKMVVSVELPDDILCTPLVIESCGTLLRPGPLVVQRQSMFSFFSESLQRIPLGSGKSLTPVTTFLSHMGV